MMTGKVANTFVYAHHMCQVFNRFFFVFVSTEVSVSVSGSHHIFTTEGKITSLLKQKKRVLIKCHYYYCGFPSFPFFSPLGSMLGF